MSMQPIQISPALAQVINSAGQKSDVDFDYLVQTAVRESSLNPKAKASTSSATGLFQFIEATWFETMKSEGARLGYENYANAIKRDENGVFNVENKKLRHEILELRKDPQIAADLAAAFTRNNGEYLENRFGRRPSAGELYIAHFLGAKGAEKMFEAGLKNPDQIAANLFPNAAKANRSIFYSNNEPRTIKQVYLSLVAKHQASVVASEFSAQQLANKDVAIKIDNNQQAPLIIERDISFQNMFTTNTNNEPRSLISDRAENVNNGAFFVQLYAK
ncbi:MAG: transglycosylase SLT domain-containing protein [Devosiaceae bacterium]|nr:transglycosylase SLT domain-containing protein [Devosiaceae bacterium]